MDYIKRATFLEKRLVWCFSAKMKVLLLVVLFAAAVFGERIRYDNYKLVQVQVETEEQLSVLKMLEDTNQELNFWIFPSMVGQKVDIMVSPVVEIDFEQTLEKYNFKSHVMIPNIQDLSDQENPEITPRAFGWAAYYPLADIYSWLDEILAANPSTLTAYVAGSTFQGRQIRGVKLSYGSGRRAIFIEANIHAREWITSATATWILNELLSSTDASIRTLAESYDWYFIPVMNPDGLVYTHTTDRMWRKTVSTNPGSTCLGTDANRNWGYNWMRKKHLKCFFQIVVRKRSHLLPNVPDNSIIPNIRNTG